MLNGLLLPLKEEDRECTGRRTISAYVMCYYTFDQEVEGLISLKCCLSGSLRELKVKEKD